MKKSAIEVQLVNDVRKCRTCEWFWGGTPPYGNFPVFDWNEDYPPAVLNQEQTTNTVKDEFMLTGKACGQGQVDPGIMHGCRKAPIMTIGINPNMTSYYPSDQGAKWSYPNLSKNERYAYYYRHHNVYQESLSLDFIKENVIEGTEIIAENNGWLVSADRSSDHRWLLLTLQYEGDKEEKQIEVAWTDDKRFVVLVGKSYSQDPDDYAFEKGDVIGGKIDGLLQDNVPVNENSTGYYQRYVYVLENFKAMIGGELADAPLSIAEDVAQHDLVACASPGWSSKYDIPRDRIASNCVVDNAYLLSQLVQSKPSVIVIVGGSSLAMFTSIFGQYLGDLNFTYENGKWVSPITEVFQLMKETTERENFLRITVDGYELKSRIVISPHFSYKDNFVEQSRLSAVAWEAFEKDFPTDSKVLSDQGRTKGSDGNNIVPVRIYGKEDAIKDDLSSGAWNVLMAYYYAPLEMLADVLAQEYKADRLSYDSDINRLKRPEGSCQFCVNDLWQFPEGCAYGKDKETPPSEGELEEVVQKIIAASKAAQVEVSTEDD